MLGQNGIKGTAAAGQARKGRAVICYHRSIAIGAITVDNIKQHVPPPDNETRLPRQAHSVCEWQILS